MPRYMKIIVWGCLGLLAILTLLIVIAAAFNWNHARPWVNKQATTLAHRAITIEGDLSVKWVRSDEQDGWHRWVPWPEISAQQLTIGNPTDSTLDGDMAQVKNLTVLLNPWALLKRTIDLPHLAIDEANVMLHRDEKGINNWTFTDKQEEDKTSSTWQFNLQQVQLSQARVHVVDIASKVDLMTELDSLQQPSETGYGVAFKTSGRYNDADISGEGQAGDILSLQASSAPFPLQGKMSVGETSIAIEGSFTRPQQLAALDVKLHLAGHSMADLYPLIGVVLPSTPPYSTEGRLIAQLEGDEDNWRYENFNGIVGESDLSGTLEYQLREPRALLTGEVESKQLRLSDLGPLIGANTSDVKGDNEENAVQPPADRILPVDPINTEGWGAMDADVKFKGLKIIRGENLPLNNIEAHITLQDRVLSLTPLNFGFAGGTLGNTITLDGRGEILQADLKTAARHLKLKELFPGAESMDASFGELHGDVTLKGQGNSIAELLAHANGEGSALVSRGTISHFLLETAGLNVANMLLLKLFGDEQVVLNCVAANVAVRDGLASIGLFKLETDDTTVDVTGNINLSNEELNLDVYPENKTLRVFTLRSPLYAKGTFKDPDVGVHAGPLATRAGAAVALGVVATPFAALLPLLNIGTNETNHCQPLVGDSNDKSDATRNQAESNTEDPRQDWPSMQPAP